ncbi:hypothetical protein ON010_g6802 [Phytophthora cinnamomi]|nr:hypothetical protein ON010_g6802 [Phytophthora cinnamomi]
MGAVQDRCRTTKNEFAPDVTSLFHQKLQVSLSIDDYDARIFRYYEDFNGIVDDNGLRGLTGDDNEADAGYEVPLPPLVSGCNTITQFGVQFCAP